MPASSRGSSRSIRPRRPGRARSGSSPAGPWDRLPSGYRTQAEDARTALLESGTDRADLIRRIQDRLGADGAPETVEDEGMTTTARDFLALGTVRWMLRDLTIAMGHADALDHESLTRELLAGAHAWQIGDWAERGQSAPGRLRGADPGPRAVLPGRCLSDRPLPARPGDARRECSPIRWRSRSRSRSSRRRRRSRTRRLHDPQGVAALRQAITDGWADVAGGAYSEAEDPLLPLESILWQFRQGSEVYRAHLDDRNVETYARRRFGLYTQLPQIAKRFGFRYALHLGFDAGRFPVRPETKRLWESPDGSSLESLLRPPLAADRPSQGWLLPWRLAATMKDDHVAALPLVHWPKPVAPWYLDLRRAAGYSPVLGRWTTLNDFFHLTDRPYETFRPEPDLYQTPYLAQAVARRERRADRAAGPASSAAGAVRGGAGDPGAGAGDRVARRPAPSSEPDVPAGPARARGDREPDRDRPSRRGRGRARPGRAGLVGGAGARHPRQCRSRPRPARRRRQRPGYLVINPLNVPRRAAVILPDAALDLRPEGPLRAAQFTDEGVCAVVDLPAFGFAWVPKEADPGGRRPSPAACRPAAASSATSRSRSRSTRRPAASAALAAVGERRPGWASNWSSPGLTDAQGKPVASQMRCERFDVDYGGPALVQATSTGTPGRSAPRQSPGLVRAAVPALDRPADPRDRGHA